MIISRTPFASHLRVEALTSRRFIIERRGLY